jgi:flagellar hook-basal body complex protein FliE
MRIDPVISPIRDISRPDAAASGGSSAASDAFRSLLENSVRNVSALQTDASASIGEFVSGEQQDPHKTILAVQRADLALDFFMQVRNKVVQAYQEIMRMPG